MPRWSRSATWPRASARGCSPPEPGRLCPWCDYRAACPAFEGEGPDVAGLAVVELQRLRRRRERDDQRIAQLERLVRDRLGAEATIEVG